MNFDTLLRPTISKVAAATAMALTLSAAPTAQSAIVIVDRTITSPLVPVATNNPFVFSFTGLPATALGAIEVTFFGDADVDGFTAADVGETLSLEIEGTVFGPFGPFDDRHFATTLSFFGSLDDEIADGTLTVTINFGAGVDTPLPGDSLSVRLNYEGEDGGSVPVPVPGSLALALLGTAGVARIRRRSGVSVT